MKGTAGQVAAGRALFSRQRFKPPRYGGGRAPDHNRSSSAA